MTILVTGAAGFIGANFVRTWLAEVGEAVVGLDCLSYSGNLGSLFGALDDPRFTFVRGNIGDTDLVARLLARDRPRAVVNFAAETHVDRSIHDPAPFVASNVDALFRLMEASRRHWEGLGGAERADFRFVHMSTDEVFGSLAAGDAPCDEGSAYLPSSPYSASKAAGDHLLRAWHTTFGFPAVIAIASNTYGPAQFPEKLIPLMILNAAAGKALPIYGDGRNVRDWLFVGDTCAAVRRLVEAGRPGHTYCVGGRNERTNLDVVEAICAVLDTAAPRADAKPHRAAITFVTDRPGHDRRYALAPDKIETELGWRAATAFADGIAHTARWYLANPAWVATANSGDYAAWIERNYGRRGRA